MKEKKIGRILKNIFIILSILFIIGCSIFYGSRLMHFYLIENPKIEENENLYKLVTLEKNITTFGEGLYEEDNEYIFKGNVDNNYVKYSGRLWRIVSTYNGNLKLVTDEVQTSLVWGVNTNYNDSLVKSWLNNEENNIKSFYESLRNTDILVNNKTCVDEFNEESVTCNEIVEDKIGLLSIYEYNLAGANESYLSLDEYWWTSNINSSKTAWYISPEGNLNNNVSSGKTYFAYGVRPTIMVNGKTKVNGGDGTIDNPYNLDIVTSNLINDKYVGDYINYSNLNWRIIETDENYVKVVLDGLVKVDENIHTMMYGVSNYMTVTEGIGNYLNNTFYNTLENKEYILNYEFNLGRYDKNYGYNFNMFTEYKEKFNVGLLQIGELFTTSQTNYFLMSRTITSDYTIYQVLDKGRIYAGSLYDSLGVRPTLYLKGDLTVIEGNGTSDSPYRIG